MSVTYDPCAPSPLLLWDTGWGGDSGMGDWVLDGESLADDGQLFTAVTLCLFSDARAPVDQGLPTDTDDPRGWWGDKIDRKEDLGETELGSLIWLYERAALTEDTIKGIEDTANASLQVLIDQGMVAEKEVTLEIDRLKGMVCIRVVLLSESGQKRFDQRYTRVWSQIFTDLI